MKKKPFRWADASAIAIGMCVWAGVAVAQPGPVLIEQQSGGIAVAEAYIIPAEYLDRLEALLAKGQVLPRGWAAIWYVDQPVLNERRNWPALIAHAKVVGSFGVSYWYTTAELMIASYLANEAGVGLTLNVMPWHITGCIDDPEDWSRSSGELGKLQEFFQRTINLGLNVNAITLDSECYRKAHPLATERLNTVYAMAKDKYPDVSVCWFGNGQLPYQYDVDCDNKSVILYASYLASQTEDIINAAAERFPDDDLVAWITLGPGYRFGWQWKLYLHELHHGYLRRLLRTKTRVRKVVIFPHTFRSGTMPESFDAFEAFVLEEMGEPLE